MHTHTDTHKFHASGYTGNVRTDSDFTNRKTNSQNKGFLIVCIHILSEFISSFLGFSVAAVIQLLIGKNYT